MDPYLKDIMGVCVAKDCIFSILQANVGRDGRARHSPWPNEAVGLGNLPSLAGDRALGCVVKSVARHLNRLSILQ